MAAIAEAWDCAQLLVICAQERGTAGGLLTEGPGAGASGVQDRKPFNNKGLLFFFSSPLPKGKSQNPSQRLRRLPPMQRGYAGLARNRRCGPHTTRER